MKKIILVIILFFIGVITTLNAQNIIYSPSISSRTDSRTTINSIELNDKNKEIIINIIFSNNSSTSTGIWMDYRKVELMQDGISVACKRIEGLSQRRIIIEGGDQKPLALIFDASLFKEDSTFDIIEREANGWTFRGIQGIRFNSGRIGEVRREVELGDKYALNKLGMMYYNGDGVPLDYDKALELFKKAAEKGLPVAYSNAGTSYLWGVGTDINAEKARQWFEAGSKLGDSSSQYYLATMYKNGNGVLKNPIKAKDLFLRSANAGHINAQYELALIYKQNNQLVEAFNWLKKCAGDNKNAQYELGLMYYYAKGTNKNNQLAAFWVKKAYENGHSEAKKVWDGLELWKYENK